MYSVGDVVLVVPDLKETDNIVGVNDEMRMFEGKKVTIASVSQSIIITYRIEEDNRSWNWENVFFVKAVKKTKPKTFNSVYLNKVFAKQDMILK